VPGWLLWTGLAVVVLLASFGIGYLLATQVMFPRPESAGTGIPVPSLYGMEVEVAGRALRDAGLGVGQVTEVASTGVRRGRVVAQEPLPDQQLRPGAEVSLAISGGAPSVRVPPLTGLGAVTARELLEAAGFEVGVQEVRSGGVAAGRVLRTEPAAGDVLTLPASVVLVVNVGPGPEPADTVTEDPDAAEWP
jgi:eukaryotic-like serine/threonine-protein kinase